METAIVTDEGGCQTVRLPKGFHLASGTVLVRHEGETVVLEQMKPAIWPVGFFEAIHISDPAFTRPGQGHLPLVKRL